LGGETFIGWYRNSGKGAKHMDTYGDRQVPFCPGGNLYRIRAGDTFFSIAQRFRISVDALIRANPGVNPDNLQIGQVICIPVAVPPTVCPPGTFVYQVRPGDTFFALARRFGTTVDAIMRVNPGVNPEALLVGQNICIPGAPGPPPPPGRIYIVQPGDTMFSIAQRFGVSVQALIQANPQIPDPNVITPGMRIFIPV